MLEEEDTAAKLSVPISLRLNYLSFSCCRTCHKRIGGKQVQTSTTGTKKPGQMSDHSAACAGVSFCLIKETFCTFINYMLWCQFEREYRWLEVEPNPPLQECLGLVNVFKLEQEFVC